MRESKHRKALAAIFADPVSGMIEWAAIARLLIAVGCRVVEGDGSRVRLVSGAAIAIFQRPHSQKEAKRYQATRASS